MEQVANAAIVGFTVTATASAMRTDEAIMTSSTLIRRIRTKYVVPGLLMV